MSYNSDGSFGGIKLTDSNRPVTHITLLRAPLDGACSCRYLELNQGAPGFSGLLFHLSYNGRRSGSGYYGRNNTALPTELSRFLRPAIVLPYPWEQRDLNSQACAGLLQSLGVTSHHLLPNENVALLINSRHPKCTLALTVSAHPPLPSEMHRSPPRATFSIRLRLYTTHPCTCVCCQVVTTGAP